MALEIPPASLRFAHLLHRHRGRAQLTQEELAERARISVRTLRDLEHGRTRYPHRTSVGRLATALQLTGEERLVFESATPRPLRAQPAPPATGTELPVTTAAVPLSRVTLLRDVEETMARAAADGRMAVVAITGPPSVGKSTFAAQCAHVCRSRLSLAAVYVDLGGDRRDAPALVRSLDRARRDRPGGQGCLLVADGVDHPPGAGTDPGGDRRLPALLGMGFTGVIVTGRRPHPRLATTRHIALSF